MYNSKRRSLVQLLLSTPLLSLFSKDEPFKKLKIPFTFSSSTRFIQTAVCTYPAHLSFEEFTESSRHWTKPDEIPLIDDRYIAQGLINKIHRDSGAGYARWVYEFKDRLAFEDWSREVGRQKVFEPSRILPGFNYQFKYTDLDETTGSERIYASRNEPLFALNLEQNFVTSSESHFRREFISRFFRVS